MDIVTDTSILLAVLLNEKERASIVQATLGHALVGPESIRWETGNAFSAMFKQKRITLRASLEALTLFEIIPIRYLEVDFKHSLKLAHDLQIYAYDAYFLDCSLRHKLPLLSLDGRIIQKAKSIGISILEIPS